MRLKIAFILLLLISLISRLSILFAQPVACVIPGPIAVDDCVDACIYCDLDYNGYSGSSADYTPDGGVIFCGTMHNNQWFAFMALSTTVEFTVQATACQNNDGLQAVIYPDCNPNSAFIACNGGSGNSLIPVVVTATTLTIGQIYWLSIDGYSGDKCDFDLNVTQGTTSPPLLNSIGPISGDTCVYPGDVATYIIADLPGPPTPDYAWTWPAGATGSATGSSLSINWGSSGGQICVEASNFCNTSPLTCIDVFVNSPIPTELVEVICENDCYTLGNNDYCSPGSYSETFANEHGCDSIVNLNLSFHPVIEATGESFVHCVGETLVLSPQVTNGQAPYTYLWDTGETSPNITVTSFNSISYTVTITDFCGTTDEVTFDITVLETPEAYLTEVIFICANDPVGTLEIEFSGPGPWDLTYMINGVLQAPILNIFDNPYLLNVTEPGDYELVSVNNPDCPGLALGTGFVFLNFVEVLLLGENVSCFGMQDGEVNLNILQGEAPYFYSWNNGAGNVPNLSGLGEGSYSVTVTDNFGCTGEASVLLTEPEVLSSNTVVIQEPQCFGDNDGIIDLTISGGISPYSYQWDNGSSEQNPDSLSSGIYFVTVTDLNACSTTDSVSISEAPELIASASWEDVNCYGENNGSIDLSVAGGLNPYIYSWSNSSNLEDLSDLAPGTYNVIVSDSNNCTTSLSIDITEPADLVTTAIQTQGVDCNDPFGGSIDLTVSGGTNPYTFLWTNGAEAIEDPDELIAGTYVVTVTDLNNCTVVDSVEITSSSGVIPSAVLSGMITCADTAVSLDGSGSSGEGPLDFEWYDSDNNLVGDSAIISVNIPGLYNLIISDNSTGCTADASLDVMANNTVPTATAQVSGMIGCDGNSVVIDGSGSTGNGNLSYEWIDPDSNVIGTDDSIAISQGGSYLLIVTDNNNGCTAEVTIEIEEDMNLPEAIATADGFINCTNQNVWLDGSQSSGNGTLNYTWLDDTGNTISTSASVEVSNSGIYNLIITDLSNNCTTQTSVEVESDMEAPTPVAAADGIINCTNQSVWLDGSQSSGNGTLEYSWQDELGNTISTNVAVEVSSSGIYNLIITDLSNNCSAQTSIEVLQDANLPQAMATADGIINCTNQSVWLDGSQSSGIGILEYSWLDDLGNTISTNASVEVSSPGIYTLTITDLSNNCTAQTSIEVLQDANLPQVIATADGIINCTNQSVWLDGSQSSGNGTLEYSWQDDLGNTISTNVAVEVSSSGIYNLIITDLSNNCSAQTNIEVLQDANLPQVIATADGIINCTNQSVWLDGSQSSGNGTLEYSWQDDLGNTISTNVAVEVSSSGIYNLIITDLSNNCSAQTNIEVLQDANLPQVIATADGIINCTNQSVWLDGSQSSGIGTLEYTWQDDLGNTISTNVAVEVSSPGIYTLTITDLSNNCSAQTSIEVLQDANIPQAIAAADGIINCTNQSVWLDGSQSSGNGTLEYSWQDELGNTISTNVAVEVSSSGIYNLIITDLSNNCSAQTSIEVLQDANLPQVIATADGIINCTNQIVWLDGSQSSGNGTLEYSWQDDLGNTISTNVAVEVSSSGIYNLIITDLSNNCSAQTSIEVLQDANIPQVIATADGIINCTNQSVWLDGSQSSGNGTLEYSWQDELGNTISTNVAVEVSSSGIYNLIITDLSNNCSAQTSIEVLQDANIPQAMATADGIINCTNQSVWLDGSQSSGNGTLEYSWQDELGNTISTNVAVEVSSSGIYNLIITDLSNNCSAQTSIEVLQDANLPQAIATADGIINCTNQSVWLDGSQSSGIGTLDYTWQDDLGNTISTNVAVEVSSSGIYNLIITDLSNNCTAQTSIEVLQDANLPQAIATADGIINCTNQSVWLDGSQSSGNGTLEYSWQDELGNTISTNVAVEVSSSGIYNLIITDLSNNCTAQTSIEVLQDANIPQAIAAADGIINCTNQSVWLDGSQSSGIGILEYSWQDDLGNTISTNVAVEVSSSGIYNLIITDLSNNCSAQTSIEVLQDANIPQVIAAADGIINCTNQSVWLDGSQSSGIGILEYSWQDDLGNTISTNVAVEVSSSGIYNLIITDLSNNCSAQTSIEVLQDANLPQAIASVNGIINCINQNVELDGSVSTGNGTLEFLWLNINGDPIGINETILVNTAGLYTLVITDLQNGCTSEMEVTVEQNTILPIANAGLNDTINCDQNSIILDGYGSSGNGPLIYEWFDEFGNTISNNISISISQAGTYTLTVMDIDNGCSDLDIVEIALDENLPEAIAMVNDTLSCAIQMVTLDGSASTSPGGNFTFEWFDPNNQSISVLESVDVSLPGLYTLTITDTQNGCTASTSIQVNQNIDPPFAEAGENLLLTCGNDVVTLNGSGSGAVNLLFEWFDDNNNSIGNTASLEVASAGIYNLQVTNTENGCTANDQTQVLIDTTVPVSEAGIGGTLSCETIELLLDGSASSSGSNMVYEWQDAAGTTLGNLLVISVNEPGTYTLFVTDTVFNCVAQDDVIVGENIADPLALIDQIGALSCADQSLVLNAGGSLPAGGLDFAWSTLDGNLLSGINTPNPEIDEPGTYQVTVTDIVNGCTDTATILITENNQLPDVIIEPPLVLTCVITQLELSAVNSSQGSEFVYTWTSIPSGGIVSGGNTLSPLVNQSGQYTLTILNTTNGCENSAAITVTEDIQSPTAVANVEDELDCITETLQINGNGSSLGPTFTYSWTGPNLIDGANTLLATVNTSGVYNLQVTDIINGCTQTTSVSVEENTAEPVAMDLLISPPSCFGDEGSMEVLFTEGGQAPYLYSIDGGQNFYDSQIFNSLSSGTFSIIVQDAVGCEYEESFSMPFTPELYIDLAPELLVQLGETGEILAYVNTPLSLIDTIIWTPVEGLSCTNCLTPQVSSFTETLYTIRVVDENGCVAADEIMFRVEKTRDVYIPTAFSPHNADGINDRFMIYAKEGIIESVNSFQVFSRWGELVFQQDNFMPNDPTAGWDGFFRGEPLQPGVFVYWAEVEFIDGFKKLYKGDVSLMR